MILPIHIIIALSSVFYTIFLFFRPSFSGLKISYALITLTIVSGTFLVISKPASMTQTCVTGLVYIAVMLIGTIFVRQKLKANARNTLV